MPKSILDKMTQHSRIALQSAFVCLLVVSGAFCRAKEPIADRIVMEDGLETETDLRQLLSRIYPDLKTSFYYFDGHQIFGVFHSNSLPSKIIMVLRPEGGILRFGVLVNGEPANLVKTPIKYRMRYRSEPGAKKQTSYPGGNLGVEVEIPQGKEVQIDIRIRQEFGEWIMWAEKRDPTKWTGGMIQVSRSEIIKPSVKQLTEPWKSRKSPAPATPTRSSATESPSKASGSTTNVSGQQNPYSIFAIDFSALASMQRPPPPPRWSGFGPGFDAAGGQQGLEFVRAGVVHQFSEHPFEVGEGILAVAAESENHSCLAAKAAPCFSRTPPRKPIRRIRKTGLPERSGSVEYPAN